VVEIPDDEDYPYDFKETSVKENLNKRLPENGILTFVFPKKKKA
jgi:hypothetical protein